MRQAVMDLKSEKLKLKTELAEAKVLAVKQDILFLELKRDNDQLKEQIALLQKHIADAEADEVYTVASTSPQYEAKYGDYGAYGEPHHEGDDEYVPQPAVDEIRSPSSSSSSSSDDEEGEVHEEQEQMEQ